jgi:hypothetical protein
MVRKLLARLFNRKPPTVHVKMEFDGNGVLMNMEYTNNNPVFVSSIPFTDEAADALEDCDLTEEQKMQVIARVSPENIPEFIQAYKNGQSFDGLMRYFGTPDDDDLV